MKSQFVALALLLTACGAAEPSSTSSMIPGPGPVARLGSARMFTTGDAMQSPCDAGIAVSLIQYSAEYTIEVEDILRDQDACAATGVRIVINPRARNYLVLAGDRTVDDRGVIHYLGRTDGNTFFSLRDHRESMFPAPQFAKWTATENDTGYLADVVE